MDEKSSRASEIHAVTTQSLFWPSIIAGCLVAAVVYFCVPRSMADPDIWWHLRDAQIQLSSHSFLNRDLFSFTASGSPWMNHEWFAELPFYAGFHLFGVNGLYYATLATIEAIFLGVLYLTYNHSRSIWSAAFVTVIGICLSTVSFGPRTLLYGWILLVVELLVFVRAQRQERIIWTLPFLFALWVNTHGSWLIGMVVFGLFVVANSFSISMGCIESRALPPQQIKRLVLCWLASAGALFLNPYGWRLVFYPFNLAFQQKLNIANIEEWKSLDFHTPRGRIMFGFLGLLFIFQLIRSRKWSLFELGLAAMGLYSAFTYSRFLFLGAILVGPLLARSLVSSSAAPRRPLSPMIAVALVFVMFCCVVGRLRNPEQSVTEGDTHFPDHALPYLDNFHPDGKVLNDFLWGGYLIWHERQIPVFVDSRVDIFEYNGTFKDYLDIIHLKDSIDLLNKHNIQYVLFEKDAPLVYLLKSTRDWKVDYEDKTTILLERITPQTMSK
jgi:hypothetical protein